MTAVRTWARGLRVGAALACALWLGAAGLRAQGVTTSAITGTVTGDNGQAVPGIQVVVTNTQTGTRLGTVTGAEGRYYVGGLQPGGPYRIQVQGLGYATETRSNVQLVLSQTTRFDFSVRTQAVEMAALEVTAERGAAISKGRTGATTTVSDSSVRRLPTITRDFTDFTRLTPQISTAGSGSSAGGRNNRFNSIQIDGAANNDLFGLAASGTPGGQAGTKPITLEAIQEFQVVLAPFDVRQSGFTGAGVNAVTRSGTNQFHGGLAYFGRSQDFVGKYVGYDDKKAADFGKFSEKSGAFSLGGPIMEDRLHFFLAGEFTRRKAPNSGFAIGRDNVYTAAEVQPIADYVRTQYQYDVGEMREITMQRQSDNLFGRVDWNITPDHRLTLRHNYVKAPDDNLTRSANSYFLGSALYKFLSKTNSTVAQLNSTLGQGKYYNELRVGYTTVRDKRDVGSRFPFITVDLPSGSLGARAVSFGSENYSAANALDQDILELTDDFTFNLGRHTLTVGTHNEFFSFSNLYARNFYGNYTFASLAAFQAGTPRRYELSYLLPGGRPRAEFPARTLGAYVQDQVSLTDRFTVTLGLRYDTYMLPDKPAENEQVASTMHRSTSDVPGASGLISPRAGFNWDVNGDRSLQLRGGAGLFAGRTPYVWISNAYGNTGLDYVRFTCSSASTSPVFVADPENQPRTCRGTTALAPNEINLIDPDFKFPQVFRADLAVDRQLPLGVVGTLEGLYTKSLNDPLYQEIALGPASGTVEGRARYTRLTTPFSNVVDITNTSKNYSYSITGQLQRPFAGTWGASVAYTYGHSYDVNSVTSSQAFSNWRYNPIDADPNNPELRPSNYDIPHRIVADATKRFTWLDRFATDLSLIYVGESGQPYSFTYYSTDLNNDGSNGNDLIYVPRSTSEMDFQASSTVTAAQSAANFDAFIERVPCLDEARGSVIKRNACRLPWTNRVDFRLRQALPTMRGQNVELTMDVLNVANLLNSDWGLSQYVSNQNDTPLQAVSGTPTPGANGRVQMRAFAPRTTRYTISDESSRYRIQLGARYSF